jgi:hypothetical protein
MCVSHLAVDGIIKQGYFWERVSGVFSPLNAGCNPVIFKKQGAGLAKILPKPKNSAKIGH